ncbi:PDZ domain-containing protein [Rhodopirellula europaea]|uniref:Serine proteinase HtrA n=1 Tax=Rhodopirellula europaea SH398 TaxID=1263868 RepID=M5S7T5_9BACT|nr:PDZ domain-containing protein [Rhodopirellula europaea]EMI27703.1 serine proteinase HtrA [Rhodopirellula europaea SH398]
MLRSRRRSNWIRWAVCLSMVSCIHAIDASDASAQRLLERLRNRIQTPPPSPLQQPPYQNPATTNRANSGRNRTLATPFPRTNSSADRRAPATQRPPAATNRQSTVTGRGGEIASENIEFGMRVSPAVVGGYQGLRVDGFSSNSRADEAGVRPGDLIVSIGNSRTRSLDEAVAALDDIRTTPGKEPFVAMQLFRGGRLYRGNVPAIASERTAAKPPITLPDTGRSVLDDSEANRNRPQDNEFPAPQLPAPATNRLPPPANNAGPTLARSRGSLGIEVRDAAPQRGVMIVSVPDGTAGKVSGLAEGDRIVSASGRLIRGTDDLLREISVLQPGDEIEFGLIRGDAMLQKQIEMGGLGGEPTRSAIANATPAAADTNGENTDAAEAPSSGFLGGMGSMFGKMLGGSASTAQAPASEELPPPNAEPKATFTLPAPAESLPSPKPTAEPSVEADPLALPSDSLTPSVESLPPAKPAPVSKPESLPAEPKPPTVEELQREIQRLKQQLQAKE